MESEIRTNSRVTCFPWNQAPYGTLVLRPSFVANLWTNKRLPINGITESWSPLAIENDLWNMDVGVVLSIEIKLHPPTCKLRFVCPLRQVTQQWRWLEFPGWEAHSPELWCDQSCQITVRNQNEREWSNNVIHSWITRCKQSTCGLRQDGHEEPFSHPLG